MREEEKIFAGQLFWPGHPDLRAIKLRSHNLCAKYNRAFEDEYDLREGLMREIVGEAGANVFMQGPIFFHYGVHTRLGDDVFINYNLVVQDDAPVTIGSRVNFGPNVTIVTPVHPMLPDERYLMLDETGKPAHLCYARPVTICDDVWIGANVLICGGVTVGAGSVLGAGSVVIRDVPPNTFAAGNPCRVIRELSEKDSMKYKPDVLAGNRVIER